MNKWMTNIFIAHYTFIQHLVNYANCKCLKKFKLNNFRISIDHGMNFILCMHASKNWNYFIHIYIFLIDFTSHRIACLSLTLKIRAEYSTNILFLWATWSYLPLIHDENMNENNKTENLIYAYICLTADDFNDDTKIYCLWCKNKL